MNKVLVYGEGEALAELSLHLCALGAQATTTSCADTASSACERDSSIDAVFALGPNFARGNSLASVSQLRVGLATREEIQSLVSLLGKEVDDCLLLPTSREEVQLFLARSKLPSKKVTRIKLTAPEITGIHGGLAKAWRVVEKVSKTDTNVLLTGESGTGKELFAQAIHTQSQIDGPFVAINCAAIPLGLFESQFFGHKKGAFTDAHTDKKGVFAKANGGTLFLDEVGDCPEEMQVKLLRVLQTGEIQPLGAEETEKVQVRLVSASSRNLEEMAESGKFRDDLYYRLATIPINLPPLRDRPEDIDQLVDNALVRYSEKHGGILRTLDPEARQRIVKASWPGNVRQLHNAVERLVVLAEHELISAELVSAELDLDRAPNSEPELESQLAELCLKDALAIVEAKIIARVLKECEGKRAICAEKLCISPRTLSYKLKEHNLQGKQVQGG